MENIKVDQLKPNMKILEFTKFAEPYAQMREKVCQFVQHNLKGASAEVVRDGNKITCPISEIQPGDGLRRVFDMPDSLAKLTTVTKGLIPELQRRGFIEMVVQPIGKNLSPQQEKRQQSVQKANEFIQTVKKSIKARSEATEAAKGIFDSIHRGTFSTDEVKNNIDHVMSESSPEALSAIAALQSSDQTYAHCVDAAAIFQNAYYAIKKKRGEPSVFESEKMAMFAAFMHDFGKAKIPKDILESTVRFERESEEMRMLQAHPVYGAELLSSMNAPKATINIAHYHHVKMDTTLNSSYPQEVSYDEVLMETRLASIVDVYQALIGRRSYKRSWSPTAAIRYIDTLAGDEFDPDIWDDFVEVMGVYPKSSLVKMSDESMGFVISVPEEDLERPEVVIFRGADGNDLERPNLVDLANGQELEIEQDLDHYEILGENAIEIFLKLEVH